MAEDIVRVLRVLEYVGPRKWVEETVARSVHGTRVVGTLGGEIRGATVGTFPEVLQSAASREAEAQSFADLQAAGGLPEAQEPPATPAIPTPAPVVEGPTPLNPDLSPCEGCGNTYIHGYVNGDACPFSPEAQQPRARHVLKDAL